jgi:hypothetical protein
VKLTEYEQWRIVLDEGGRASATTIERIRQLERELARKEKALAEAAALLILKKKAETLYWEDEDGTRLGARQRRRSRVDVERWGNCRAVLTLSYESSHASDAKCVVILAHVTGHERREALRTQLAVDGDDAMPDLLVDLFETSDRKSFGSIHPALMGGEYLPPFLSDETEVARISLESTTADQISVRAQRLRDGIAYRIVDEYEDMSPDYECHPSRSQVPLTLAEVIALNDGSLPDGGAALLLLYRNVENSGEDPILREPVLPLRVAPA